MEKESSQPPPYPFNEEAVLWFQAWRKMIREANLGGPNEDFYRHQACIAQGEYLAALVTGDKQ